MEEKLMTKPRRIGVEAMDGMTRKQVRITNAVANDLIAAGMCRDCAVNIAVDLTWTQIEPRTTKRRQTWLCSEACSDVFQEFAEEMLCGPFEEVPVEQMPGRAH
jgi:hypothetical protein